MLEKEVLRLPRRRHDPGVDLADGGMLLGDLPFRRQVELLVDPVGHARASRLVVDDDRHGAVEDLGGVEDVVDLFVLRQPVDVDAALVALKSLPAKG